MAADECWYQFYIYNGQYYCIPTYCAPMQNAPYALSWTTAEVTAHSDMLQVLSLPDGTRSSRSYGSSQIGLIQIGLILCDLILLVRN